MEVNETMRGGGHSMTEGIRNAYKILATDLKERYHFGDIGIYRRIILKWSVEKWDIKKRTG
jgi:hypothetical protein